MAGEQPGKRADFCKSGPNSKHKEHVYRIPEPENGLVRLDSITPIYQGKERLTSEVSDSLDRKVDSPPLTTAIIELSPLPVLHPCGIHSSGPASVRSSAQAGFVL